MRMKHTQRQQRGATLVEVLVTMVILAIGLFGLIGLHGRVQLLQLESYQRAQALMLLDDMANRLTNNRYDVAAYDTAAPVGTGDDCAADYVGVSRRLSDTREWCEALQGAGELSSGGDSVGAMIGGRGCVDDLGNGDFLVTVAWQGMAPISAPPANVTCGADLYDGGEDSPCTDDLCRRVVTTLVHIPDLT
jgi:type IV pilus assembly protein PilV